MPVENRLGEEGEGFKIIMRALQPGRVNVAGKALGVAEHASRTPCAMPTSASCAASLGRFQMIQSEIAEIAIASKRAGRSSTRPR